MSTVCSAIRVGVSLLGSDSGSVYSHVSLRGELVLRESFCERGYSMPVGISMLPFVFLSSLWYLICMENMFQSATLNSRTLNAGLFIAHSSDAPRATLSAALSVCVTFFWKKAASCSRTAGMRLVPPTTSMQSICSLVRPASLRALSQVSLILPKSPPFMHISSHCPRVSTPEQSLSSIMHSTLMGVSRSTGLADRVFLSFSHCALSRSVGLKCVRASTPNLVLNSSEKCWKSTSSTSLPPKLRSHVCESTLSWPFLNATTETCMQLYPLSTMTTWRGLSSGRSVLVIP
mmetsp:Transcript_25602/g.63062  ORF Transcript_25602/g.63062 Transcript_25602/m.63062 type:complete len:289 (+) Transcript_25602:1398-2264(+)